MPALKWTYEKLAEEALKYTTKVEFLKGNASAYGIAGRKGFLNEICSHMVCGKTKYTDEYLKNEALKFNTRGELRNKSRSVHSVAIHRGILDDICSHMKPVIGSWKNLPLPSTKTCSICKLDLTLSKFTKSKHGIYGVENKCSKCRYKKILQRESESDVIKVSNKIRSVFRNTFHNYTDKKKNKKTEDILGCSIKVFREYIESQFDEKMSWDNYGRNGWHLDHKVPISLAQNEKDVYKLNHYTNFQPLWEFDNIYKSNKMLPEFVELKNNLLSNDTKRTSET